MYFKQKLAYTALGCLFTIIGYTLASLSGNPVNAQSQADKSSNPPLLTTSFVGV